MWNDILWWPKVAQLVLVVRLQDRFSSSQQPQLLRHNIKIMAFRMQRCDAEFLTLLTVKPVIIVGAEQRRVFRDQYLDDSSTQCRLSSITLSSNPQHVT